MIVNSERNMGRSAQGRRAAELRTQLRAALKRDPTHAELAEKSA